MDYDSLVKGTDCSHWNGKIDFIKLADDGVSFIYLKATQNVTEDPLFTSNATGAEAAGLLVLAYAFITANDDDASVEKFKSVVGDMPAVLDCEVAGLAAPLPVWIAGMAGRPTLAYIGIAPPFTPPPAVWTLPRILPDYASRPRLSPWDGVSTPNWQNEWVIWQRSSTQQFQGEVGNFDLDVLAISLDRFKNWCQTGSWAA